MRSECLFHNWRGAGRCPGCQASKVMNNQDGCVQGASLGKISDYWKTKSVSGMIDVSDISVEKIEQHMREQLNNPRFGERIISRKAINYIATYQAQCVDGNQVTANLALSDVPEGASPGSLIEIITEQAYADIARSGMNATSVLVLNLSRVW